MRSVVRQCDGCGKDLGPEDGVILTGSILPQQPGAGEPFPRLNIDACDNIHALLAVAKALRENADTLAAAEKAARDHADSAASLMPDG